MLNIGKHHRTYRPDRILLLGIDFEVLVGELSRWQVEQLQIGPALNKLEKRMEGIDGQAVVGIVRLMCHEHVDRLGDQRGEQFAAEDAGLEPCPPTGVPIQVDGVRVQAARLTRQHQHILVPETSTLIRRPQMWILFGAGHTNTEHAAPGIVEWLVHWVDARVMRRDDVGVVHADSIRLRMELII